MLATNNSNDKARHKVLNHQTHKLKTVTFKLANQLQIVTVNGYRTSEFASPRMTSRDAYAASGASRCTAARAPAACLRCAFVCYRAMR